MNYEIEQQGNKRFIEIYFQFVHGLVSIYKEESTQFYCS